MSALDAHYRSLVEHCLDAIGVIRRDGTFSYISPAIEQVLGYSPAEFVALAPFEVVHPDERPEAVDRFEKLANLAGSTQTVVNRVRHRDGSWRWIEIVSRNQLHVPGIGAVITSFRDISARKQAALASREAEEKFRGIVESATGFAIFTTDLNGKVNSWNSGAAQLLGYEEAEVLGKDCRILFTPEDNATNQPESEMRDAVRAGKGNDERWHVKKDGSRFWGSGLMMPLRDDSGEVRGYLKIFRDMTRARLAEESLHEVHRRKDEFLAMLAHELRNPLAGICNAVALLSDADNRIAEWAKQVITRQAGILSHLLDDLLDVVRVTQGKIRLQPKCLDLARVIRDAAETITPLAERKRQSLTLDTVASEIPVWGNAIRLEQVLTNLLTNAVKFTNSGGNISISTELAERVVVRVSDDGIGIEPAMLARIFQPFAQADRSLDRSQGGLGVGLALAKTLIELHGGSISAASQGRDQGSEFTVILPLAPNTSAGESQQNHPQAPPPPKLHILVVDDNYDSATSLSKILSTWGHKVTTVYDGPAALAAAETISPDFILMDIGLPGLSGYEVASQLRASHPDRNWSLIAVSGYGQPEDRRRSQAAGFDAHFVKPIDFAELANVFERPLPADTPPRDC